MLVEGHPRTTSMYSGVFIAGEVEGVGDKGSGDTRWLRYRHTLRSIEHAPEIYKFRQRSFFMVKSKTSVLGLLSSLDYQDFQIVGPRPKGMCCISVSPCDSFFLMSIKWISVSWESSRQKVFYTSLLQFLSKSFGCLFVVHKAHMCKYDYCVKEGHITWLQKWYWCTSLSTRIRKCSFLNFNDSCKNTFMKHQ